MSVSQTKAANSGQKSWDETYQDNFERGLNLARYRLPLELRIEAEDIVNDVYIRLREKGRGAETLEDPANYFLKCIQNRCFDLSSRSKGKAAKTVYLDASRTDEEKREIMELRDPGRGPAMDVEINDETDRLRRILEAHSADLTKRETDLLALHLQGFTNDEIATAWGEDVKGIKVEKNALIAKIRYRLMHRQGKEDGES
jgi:RNA polymerase sigma factor (sigma-70 family)